MKLPKRAYAIEVVANLDPSKPYIDCHFALRSAIKALRDVGIDVQQVRLEGRDQLSVAMRSCIKTFVPTVTFMAKKRRLKA